MEAKISMDAKKPTQLLPTCSKCGAGLCTVGCPNPECSEYFGQIEVPGESNDGN